MEPTEVPTTIRVKDSNRYWWEARCRPVCELPGDYTGWEIELWRDDVWFDTISCDLQTGCPIIQADVSSAILNHYGALAINFARGGKDVGLREDDDVVEPS